MVQEGLDRLHDQLRDLEHNRVAWQGQLAQQVLDMRHTTDSLRRETQSLSTALRKPQVRGRWGELHLRRAVELAGLVDHCDFSEQPRLDDGARRPDLVVHLAGGRAVVVDAKVPLDAFLDATAATDDEGRDHGLRRHAAQLRAHVDGLSRQALLARAARDARVRGAVRAGRVVPVRRAGGAARAARVRRRPAGGARHPDHADRAAAHGRPRLEPRGAGRRRPARSTGWAASSTTGSAPCRATSTRWAAPSTPRSATTTRRSARWESRVLVSARRFADLSVTDDELAPPRQVEVAGRSVAPVPLHAVRPARRRPAGSSPPLRVAL